MKILDLLGSRKTFILKEPLVKRLRLTSEGNSDDLIEKYIIKERILVPGPEVKRIRV